MYVLIALMLAGMTYATAYIGLVVLYVVAESRERQRLKFEMAKERKDLVTIARIARGEKL